MTVMQHTIPRIVYLGLVILSALSIGILAWQVHSTNNQLEQEIDRNTERSMQTHNALCAVRADYVLRVKDSEQFLKDHPNGVAGIPPEVIQQGINNQKRTIAALDEGGLECS